MKVQGAIVVMLMSRLASRIKVLRQRFLLCDVRGAVRGAIRFADMLFALSRRGKTGLVAKFYIGDSDIWIFIKRVRAPDKSGELRKLQRYFFLFLNENICCDPSLVQS